MLREGINLESQSEGTSSSDVRYLPAASTSSSSGSLPAAKCFEWSEWRFSGNTDRTLQTLSRFHETISCRRHAMESKSVETKIKGHCIETVMLKILKLLPCYILTRSSTIPSKNLVRLKSLSSCL